MGGPVVKERAADIKVTESSGNVFADMGLAEPEEVAALFAFLASEEARSITGAIYALDNGLTAS